MSAIEHLLRTDGFRPRSLRPRPEWAAVVHAGVGMFDLASGLGDLTPAPSSGFVAGGAGVGARFSGTGAAATSRIVPGISTGITAVMIVEPRSTTINSNFLFGEAAASSGAYNYGFYSTSANYPAFFVHNGTTGVSSIFTFFDWKAVARPQVWVATYGDGDNNIRLFVDGVETVVAQTGSIQRNTGAHLGFKRWNAAAGDDVLYLGAVSPRRMSPADVRERFRSVESTYEAVFGSLRIFVPVSAGGGAQSVSIGQVIETGTAQAFTAVPGARTLTIGQATEVDTAQPMTAGSSLTAGIGQAVETDTAQAMTALRSIALAIGQASETDTAQPVSTSGTTVQAIGQALESDVAQAMTAQAAIALAIGQAAEADTAQPLTVASAIAAAIGQAAESDSAQPLTLVQAGATAIGQAQETDLAQPMTVVPGALALTIGQATESDAAQPMGAQLGLTVGIGLALEIDTAGAFTPLVGGLTVPIGQAVESNLAQPMTVGAAGGTAGAADVWNYVLSNGLTAEETAVQTHAMLTSLTAALGTCPADLALVLALLRNKQITNPNTGTLTVYADDGVTPLLQGNLFEDAGGTVPYRGQGAERRERLT